MPYFWMRAFSAMTGEVGIVTAIQAFFLAWGVFKLMGQLIGAGSRTNLAVSNIFAMLVLLVPIQLIYSAFQTFDTPAAAIMLWLNYFIIKFWRAEAGTIGSVCAISILLFMLVSYRLPALPICILVVFCVFGLAYKRSGRSLYLAASAPALAFLVVPFAIVHLVSATPTSLWIGGSVWRYMIAAPQSQNPDHEAFLQKIETHTKATRGPPCYVNVFCEPGDYWTVLDHIRVDKDLKKTFLTNFASLAIEEPVLFWRIHLEFAGYALGVQAPLLNAELGRWRDKTFQPRIEALGFKSNERREWVIDSFAHWMNGVGSVFLRPLYMMLATLFLVGFIGLRRKGAFRHSFAMRCSIPLMLGSLYYLTFLPVSQSHELRYFYPAALLLQVIWGAVAASLFVRIGALSYQRR